MAEFVAVGENASLRLVCGAQGGQHIWVSIRTHNAGGRAQRITFAIRDAADAALCGLDFASVDLAETGDVGGISGMTCVVPNQAEFEGRSMRLVATVVDAFGRSATDQRAIVILSPDPPCR